MKIKETKEFTIGKHFISAIYYGDLSGIDRDDEVEAVSAFIEEVGTGTIEIVEDSDDFRWCDITQIKSDTVDILVHYFESDLKVVTND